MVACISCLHHWWGSKLRQLRGPGMSPLQFHLFPRIRNVGGLLTEHHISTVLLLLSCYIYSWDEDLVFISILILHTNTCNALMKRARIRTIYLFYVASSAWDQPQILSPYPLFPCMDTLLQNFLSSLTAKHKSLHAILMFSLSSDPN